MEITGWITLAAVLVALGIGVSSIIQTNKLKKGEKRERLLNEIIEWALDVSTRSSPVDILKNPEWLLSTKPDEEEKIRYLQIYACMDLMNQYSLSYIRGEYISLIASRIRNDLGEAVDDLISKIEKYLKVLQDGAEHPVTLEEYGTIIEIITKEKAELRAKLSEEVKYQLKVFDDRLELNKSAKRVIEIAVEIETRDIGKTEENMSKEGEATGSNEPTLKDIEEHLKQQDRQIARGAYFAGAAVGASIILVAVSLWVGRTVVSPNNFFVVYIFLLACGFGFMFWCWYKQRKTKS